MLEKLTTHDIQDVVELFSLADKCARAIEGHAWHTSPALRTRKDSKPNAGTAAQGGNKKPLAGTPTAAAAVTGGGRDLQGNKRPRQAFGSDDGGARCPVHNSAPHSASE
jgi:hypothetical protein